MIIKAEGLLSNLKRCGECKTHLNIDKFYKNKRTFDGIANRCITCNKKYKLEHKSNYKISRRAKHLKDLYNLTDAEYNELLLKQSNCCAICKSTSPGRNNTNFPIDHCHKTGKIRGLLCNTCNRAIGLFKDS